MIHLIVTVVRLARPGGLRSVLAESQQFAKPFKALTGRDGAISCIRISQEAARRLAGKCLRRRQGHKPKRRKSASQRSIGQFSLAPTR